MNNIEEFTDKIENFNELDPADLIDYFAYFITEVDKKPNFAPKDITKCFKDLRTKSYSNIPQYLNKNLSGKTPKFIKNGDTFVLCRNLKIEIEENLGKIKKPKPRSDLFSINIVEKTRGYIVSVAEQANTCYDYQQYDACLVMLRRLIETLIIEMYEKSKLEEKIKDRNGNYLFLGEIIPILLNDKSWNLSRNTQSALPQIKKYGDLSAHNRHFNAKKADIDSIKQDVRIVLEEFIHKINY